MKIKENLQLKKDNDDLAKRLQQAEEETEKVLRQKMEVDEQMLKLLEVPGGGQDTNEEKLEIGKGDTKEDDEKAREKEKNLWMTQTQRTFLHVSLSYLLLSFCIAFHFYVE